MKLTCDLCGGALQMAPDGNGAVCVNCGITYSLDRLQAKLGTAAPQAAPVQQNPAYNAQWTAVNTAPVRSLRLRRKFDMFICKAVAVVDGQAMLLPKPGKEIIIPVSCGTHTISIRILTASGLTQLQEMVFTVADRDWNGEVWLQRGAFKAEFKFQMWEQ